MLVVCETEVFRQTITIIKQNKDYADFLQTLMLLSFVNWRCLKIYATFNAKKFKMKGSTEMKKRKEKFVFSPELKRRSGLRCKFGYYFLIFKIFVFHIIRKIKGEKNKSGKLPEKNTAKISADTSNDIICGKSVNSVFSEDDNYSFANFTERHRECKVTVNFESINELEEKELEIIAENNDIHRVRIRENTVMVGVDGSGEYDCIYKYKKERSGVIRGRMLCIIDSKQYSYFLKETDLEKRAENITGYSLCSTEQREYMIKKSVQQKPKIKKSKVKTNGLNVITNHHSLEAMYNLCKHTLPPDLQFQCKDLVKDLHCGGRRSNEAAMILSDILYTCTANSEEAESEYPSFEEMVQILEKYHYGDREIIEWIALQIRLLCRCESKGTVFALLGPPGVGKTALAKGIAECLRKPFCELECKDKSMVDMGGVSRIYEGARHGDVMEKIVRFGNDCCILLDEYDKMHVSEKDGNPYNLFISAWDDRKTYLDMFINVPIPVENMCWILTFNDIDKVPEFIKNRFQSNIFIFDAYGYEKKTEIGKRFLIPKFMKQYNFTENDLIFTDEGLLTLAKSTNDTGARVLSQEIEKLLGMVNNKLENGAKTPIIIDEEFISEFKESYSKTKGKQKTMGFVA